VTWEFFETQMARLRGLRFVPADMTTHWEALNQLPESTLEAAVTRAGRTRVEFPTPIELRQDADQSTSSPSAIDPDPSRGTDLPEPRSITVSSGPNDISFTLPVRREWKYYCETCSDSGWRSLFCGNVNDPIRKPWWEHRTCDRRVEHAGHEWVSDCPCREWNPAIKRRKERLGKYAEKPGKVA
jgi:hypothetical protein